MYIIINKTTNLNTVIHGSFPLTIIEEALENGEDLIIMSTYSYTIKIPYITENPNYGDTKSGYDWGFKDYNYKF